MAFRYESLEDGQIIDVPQARPDLDVLASWKRTGWADVPSISGTPEESLLGGPFPTGPNVSEKQNSNNSGPNSVGDDATPDEVFVHERPARVFDAGQEAADYEAEHGIPNEGPRPNGGPSEEDYAAAVERTEAHTERVGRPAGSGSDAPATTAEATGDAIVGDERPKENGLTADWAAYAEREHIELGDATKREDIILAVKRAQQPALSAKSEEWEAYVTGTLGVDAADIKDLNRDQLAQKYGVER
jgi:hypothetical protein